MKLLNLLTISAVALASLSPLPAQTVSPRPVFTPIPAFPLTHEGSSSHLVISRPVQPTQPFTVAGPRGVLVGTQDGSFESWILPVKLISHLTIEADIEGYTVPIPVNPQSAHIEVRPDHTTITYSHPGFTLRQIMFSPNIDACSQQQSAAVSMTAMEGAGGFSPRNTAPGNGGALALGPCLLPSTGPIVLFQIDALHPTDFIFRFTPEMRWMWPRRNDGIPGPDWVTSTPPTPTTSAEPPQSTGPGYYVLHMDYPDLAGAITIPGALPGILAPYQERPQVHPLELRLHYDPKRDGNKLFPLLMAVGTTRQTASNEALGKTLASLNESIASSYSAHAEHWQKLLAETTSIETPDKSLNEAFQWGVVSIEQLKALEYPGPASPAGVTSPETALVAGYYQSADSARPGFGWFFGRDALYTLYAVNGFGDFALTRSELEFLIRRQRPDGKIMHEYSQTANDPTVDWPSFPYMYAAADATPLFLMAVRDYYRSSGDLDFLKAHREAIEKAWSFETDPAHDTDHDGIYDNSQGTGWVESWPGHMPHQEIYLALLDEQASRAYSALETAFSDPAKASTAQSRADQIKSKIEQEYYDSQKGCYAFATNPAGTPNSPVDHTTTVYPAIAWWDDNTPVGYRVDNHSAGKSAAKGSVTGHDFSRADKPGQSAGASAPEASLSPLAHPEACLSEWAGPTLDTDWGLRDVANSEPYYDGLSYHQGSVWPLFTGWAALAEYRANQPLAGEQLLMQNVDLTWAQDPGAVTELLSGDYFIPFGRSTSHQLWSSAMVITPILRGLFGLSLDASTNTITLNPHLPAHWAHASVSNLHLGDKLVSLNFNQTDITSRSDRANAPLTVIANAEKIGNKDASAEIKLRSDLAGVHIPADRSHSKQKSIATSLEFPAHPVEPILPEPALPAPGSRTGQLKVLSAMYGENQLTLELSGSPDSSALIYLRENGPHRRLQIKGDPENRGPVAKLFRAIDGPLEQSDPRWQPWSLELHFPKGEDQQATEVTLTW